MDTCAQTSGDIVAKHAAFDQNVVFPAHELAHEGSERGVRDEAEIFVCEMCGDQAVDFGLFFGQ